MEYGLILTIAAFVLTPSVDSCRLVHCCLFIAGSNCFSIALLTKEHALNTTTFV